MLNIIFYVVITAISICMYLMLGFIHILTVDSSEAHGITRPRKLTGNVSIPNTFTMALTGP